MSCSKSCGGGIQRRTRTCSNPTPRNTGRYCVGSSSQTQGCNISPCVGKKGMAFLERCDIPVMPCTAAVLANFYQRQSGFDDEAALEDLHLKICVCLYVGTFEMDGIEN